MKELDLLVGSGGVLSHAPRREQSARMLIDSFLPEGITQLAVDSIFMMPQLGVMANIEKEELSEEAKKAAFEVFEKDCLIHLGTCIAPTGKAKQNLVVLTAELTLKNGNQETHKIQFGELLRIEVPFEPVNVKLTPGKGLDIGSGKNEPIETTIYGGVVGIIFDGRGRPLDISKDPKQRIDDLKKWSDAINEYPNLNQNSNS